MNELVQRAYVKEHFVKIGFIDGMRYVRKGTNFKDRVNIRQELILKFGKCLLC